MPARLVEGVHPHAVGAQQRLGQQAALQAGRLLLAQLDLVQPAGVLVGPLALDRVADGPGQQDAVDLALDQVVLQGNERIRVIVQPREAWTPTSSQPSKGPT